MTVVESLARAARATMTDAGVELLSAGDERRRDVENALAAAGHAIPLMDRMDACNVDTWKRGRLLVLRDATGAVDGAVCVHERPIPVHLDLTVLHVSRLGAQVPAAHASRAARALVGLVRHSPRAVRLDVDLFSRDAQVLAAFGSSLGAAGFRRSEGNSYSHTLVIDLVPSLDEILQRLPSDARRNIRSIQKAPLALRQISDARWIARMEALRAETLARTGGAFVAQDWAGLLALGARQPHLSHTLGVFRTDREGPESLIAFVHGRNHGDHVEYADGASTRPVDLKGSLAYAPLWQLVCWAKEVGARWFDLGGVTVVSPDDEPDALAGISDFKRRFSSDLRRVGEGWAYDSPSLLGQLARGAQGLARLAGARGRQSAP